APAHPVTLTSWTGHGAVVNTAGLRAAGVADNEADPLGGGWGRHPGSDRLDGRHSEYAQFLLARRAWGDDATADSAAIRSIRSFAGAAVSLGITSVQNMSWLPTGRFLDILEHADVP